MQALDRPFATLALTLAAAAALAQAPAKPGPWFTSKEVAPGVLRIDDHGSDNMYLVLGKSKALLVDTGLGVGRLADFVKGVKVTYSEVPDVGHVWPFWRQSLADPVPQLFR